MKSSMCPPFHPRKISQEVSETPPLSRNPVEESEMGEKGHIEVLRQRNLRGLRSTEELKLNLGAECV